MTTSGSTTGGSTRRERCDPCDRETQHGVRIELRAESRKRENAEFSREPYRIAVCRHCGETRVRRMNDA